MAPRRRSKTIFKVSCGKMETKTADISDYKVDISRGVTGQDMTYSLIALLTVVYSHEVNNGSKLSIDGFMNYLGMLLKSAEIGVPKDD